MTFKGTVFLFNNPASRKLEVHVSNHAQSPGLLTHNIRATEAEAVNRAGRPQHDDNAQFGHGDPVPAGTDSSPRFAMRSFPIGGTYRTGDTDRAGNWNWRWSNVTIQPGAWIRVGFRKHAWAAVEIPKAGELVEIPYEQMQSQQNSPMGAGYQGGDWPTAPIVRDGSHVPPALRVHWDALAPGEPYVVKGEARIVPLAAPGAPDQLLGWEVWFSNQAQGEPREGQTHGFTATVTLVNANGEGAKNAGLGLESMACPAGGYSARQVILFDGDYGAEKYGVKGLAGTAVRLGIRGHSAYTTTLPQLREGARTVNLKDFERTGADNQSDWFDGPALLGKMGEKKGQVDFYREGARINDELPDTVYRGEEAFIRAEF